MSWGSCGGTQHGVAPERVWSTAGAPEAEQFALWREAVSDAFVPVSVARPQGGGFNSTVAVRTVGPAAISRIASQPQSVVRSWPDIERRRGDVFFLNLPLAPGTSAVQDGRTARLSKGDFVLVDSNRPFELGFERDFRQISLALPHDCLMPLLAAPWDATAVRVEGSRGVGAVVSGTLRAFSTSAGTLDRHGAEAVVEEVARLVALALGTAQTPPRSTSRALLLQGALDEVERRLGDPELSPGRVAEHVGISVRYLHRLFADRGTTFGRWVLARRLERCLRDLDDPTRAHWTVGDIARRHGFADASYFARAFRGAYGVSPREHRRARRG